MMYITYTTMLINLVKTEDELWQQIGNLRTDVRKALKNGVEVYYTPSSEDRQQALNLYLEMMKKKYLPVEKSFSLEGQRMIIAKS